jgi:hypothetical protein
MTRDAVAWGLKDLRRAEPIGNRRAEYLDQLAKPVFGSAQLIFDQGAVDTLRPSSWIECSLFLAFRSGTVIAEFECRTSQGKPCRS